MKHYLLLLALLCGCKSQDLGVVVKGHVDGSGTVASDGKHTLIFAKGLAEAGIYQVESDGELRLVREGVAKDGIRVIDREADLDVTVKLGEPLPAWCEPIVRRLITTEQIAELGITFSQL